MAWCSFMTWRIRAILEAADSPAYFSSSTQTWGAGSSGLSVQSSPARSCSMEAVPFF